MPTQEPEPGTRPGGLAPLTGVTLPDLDTGMTADAMNSHRALRDAEAVTRPAFPPRTHLTIPTR